MTPQYLPVPEPTSGMAVGSIIGIAILLLISVIVDSSLPPLTG